MTLALPLRINLISLLFTTVVALVLSCLGSGFLYRQQSENALLIAGQAVESLRRDADTLLALNMDLHDFNGFEHVTADVLQGNMMLNSASLKTLAGEVLYTSSRPAGLDLPLLSRMVIRFTHPFDTVTRPLHEASGALIGHAEIRLDRRLMIDAALQRAGLLLLCAAVLFAGCVLIQQLVFWRTVGRPLSLLMNAVDSIRPDQLETPPEFSNWTGNDDIGRLYRAFAALLQRLTDARRALLAQNERLEQTILERTQELQRVNSELEQDIERRKTLEMELRTLASTDALTGLANRAFIMPYLERRLAQARRENSMCGVMIFDFDGFKAVNDRHGHAVGDKVLQNMARRMAHVCRQSDVLARLGGDEFLLVFDTQDIEQARAVGHRIEAQFDTPLDLGHVQIRLGISIGIALFPLHGETMEALLMHADSAMYAAKLAGGGLAFAQPPAASA